MWVSVLLLGAAEHLVSELLAEPSPRYPTCTASPPHIGSYVCIERGLVEVVQEPDVVEYGGFHGL